MPPKRKRFLICARSVTSSPSKENASLKRSSKSATRSPSHSTSSTVSVASTVSPTKTSLNGSAKESYDSCGLVVAACTHSLATIEPGQGWGHSVGLRKARQMVWIRHGVAPQKARSLPTRRALATRAG
eukprot:2164063-Prymnesium_polylepis.1